MEKDEDKGLHLHSYREAVVPGGFRLYSVAPSSSPALLPTPHTSYFVNKPNKPNDSLSDCWANPHLSLPFLAA